MAAVRLLLLLCTLAAAVAAVSGAGNSTVTCEAGAFACADGMLCVPSTWRCDIEHDCSDGSDEWNCAAPACATGDFRCDSGRCIHGSWRCDGDQDCPNGSDEQNCSSTGSEQPEDHERPERPVNRTWVTSGGRPVMPQAVMLLAPLLLLRGAHAL
ncbi:very low-density lipoprotein receptor-like [Pollicipes pollicipes]|uniref:very low-density lipoprotein receptor-like n=1 Tax=Pollicipes pollicipes TaxID=41117 RepID=UPI001884EEAF|nr:very low-density lipoprotein receptor-like [Pollicipes pollicipes]XP_037083560.1 very low-density lipoprotein receptor-like [Pollicipes pollicipes]